MNRNVSAKKVILVSFCVDLLDILVNLTVALFTGSAVMAAELMQGISDLIASGLLLIGLQRPKNEVYVWTRASTFVMLLVASTFSFYFGVERFLHPHVIDNIVVAYIALSMSVISNGYAFILSVRRILGKEQHLAHVVRKFKSSPLVMTKNTFVLDLMGMSAAMVGLCALVLYQVFGDIRFDGIGAMGIGIVLGFLSLRLALDLQKIPKKNLRSVDM